MVSRLGVHKVSGLYYNGFCANELITKTLAKLNYEEQIKKR